MQKKSIYVVYTGGTIGMQHSDHGYIPVSGHLQRQLAKMPEFHREEMPNFTIKEHLPLIDSSNITPEDWNLSLMILARIIATMMVLSSCMVPIPWHLPLLHFLLCLKGWQNQLSSPALKFH